MIFVFLGDPKTSQGIISLALHAIGGKRIDFLNQKIYREKNSKDADVQTQTRSCDSHTFATKVSKGIE